MEYDHTCETLTFEGTPDPWLIRHRANYYFTFTAGNRVEVWSSKTLIDFYNVAKRHVIWQPPPGLDHSADIWAPELHALRGRWYVYYTAAHPALGNKSHRMYVIGGPPDTEDPTQGQWEFLGRIHGMPDEWAIDGTVFEMNNELYFVYSGWPLDNYEDSDLIQQLFIMKLANPTTAASQPVLISTPEQPWEFTVDGRGDHGINEGPQFLGSLDGKWKGIVYSCAGSWTREYKMAVLHYAGGDPLDPRSWPKSQDPLIQANADGHGPWGPGHGSFIILGDEIMCVFHGTDNPDDGWENRKARCQLVAFTEGGPYMGMYCGGSQDEERPRGSVVMRMRRRLSRRLSNVPQLRVLREMLEGR